MKKTVSWILILLFWIIWFFGCQKAKTIIEPKAGESQVLIIKEAPKGAVEVPEIESPDEYYSNMLISHHHSFVSAEINSMVPDLLSRTTDYANITVYGDPSEPVLYSLDLGEVRLGGLLLEDKGFDGRGYINGKEVVDTIEYSY